MFKSGGRQCRNSDLGDCQEQCANGHAGSCADLGVMYQEGAGAPKSLRLARQAYTRACDGGNTIGCGNLGLLYGFEQPTDPQKAIVLLQRTCDGGEAYYCGSLGDIYRDAEGVPADLTKAMELYGRACDGNDSRSCSVLASHVYRGLGVPKDETRGLALFEKACVEGDSDSCHIVRKLASDLCDADPKKNFASCRAACERPSERDHLACETVCQMDNSVCVKGCETDGALCRMACENGAEGACLDRCAAFLLTTTEMTTENPCHGLNRSSVAPRMLPFLRRELASGCQAARDTGNVAAMQGFAIMLGNAKQNLSPTTIEQLNSEANQCLKQ
jgi:hypothetical protein